MDKEIIFDTKIEYCKKELIHNLESLIKHCQHELDKLKTNDDYKSNSVGIILRNKIDILNSELQTLYSAKEIAITED